MAGGLARHLDVDPLVLRVAFVVLVFFGGAGLIAYGACWLLVPDEATGSAPVRLDDRSRSVVLVLVGALALLALLGDAAWGGYGFPWPLAVVGVVAIVLFSLGGQPSNDGGPASQAASPHAGAYAAVPASTLAGAPPLSGGAVPRTSRRSSDPRRRGPLLFWFTLALVAFGEGLLGMVDLAGGQVPDSAYPALAVALMGSMLVIGSFVGRAGGLILAGLVATVVLVAATIAEQWDGETVRETPTSASAVSAAYQIDAGELVLDLRDVSDLASLDGRTIRVDGGIGLLEVILPADLDARVVTEVDGAGDIGIFGEHTDGIDIALTRRYDGGDDVPALTIDAELGLGEIKVTH